VQRRRHRKRQNADPHLTSVSPVAPAILLPAIFDPGRLVLMHLLRLSSGA
jgi:hypothetical protein